MSLVPILPDAVNQVYTMQFVSIAFLGSICLLLPWKVWHANDLDAFVTACTIVVLGIAAIVIEDADIVYACVLATVSILFMFLAVPVGIFVKLVAMTTRLHRKPYDVFSCATSSWRAELSRGYSTRDSPRAITSPSSVGRVSRTRPLAVLCTPNIVLRPWYGRDGHGSHKFSEHRARLLAKFRSSLG